MWLFLAISIPIIIIIVLVRIIRDLLEDIEAKDYENKILRLENEELTQKMFRINFEKNDVDSE
ncbi:hypothetical protein DOS74_03120 [Staphylococcus felis]|uniref:Uncharacterized protein n=1 Tax=Staphylococcus felis TaxID=46127 RepID=A0A3E0IKQ6_9STAP|nr:hypothetical protein [Staphylococcus felis]REH82320.1 hypothetical protein DOS61_09700 [Staphylococcus felis]REH89013.1 hypothetical protein DOS83_13805 [Staphylococcus felis]REH92867.1 hypothetical protein DOS58_00425 [Staphylococcus felis]REI15166.1 hypothetical protein DOS75_09900 [Staphylococcus felis]REI17863.1 hypothetical protein DOS74_03120 [Staphylococcus felis]